MQKDMKIRVRDKVDMFIGEGRYFRTMVEDIADDGKLLVGIPSYAGMQWKLKKGQEISLAFYRDSGVYSTNAKFTGYKDVHGLTFMAIKMGSKLKKEQRRNFYRLPVLLKVEVYEPLDSEGDAPPSEIMITDDKLLEKATSFNVSVSGIGIKAKNEYELGQRYLLFIHFCWPNENSAPLSVNAEVKHVDVEPESGIKRVGLHFIDSSQRITEFISKFILFQQQRQIRQRRLIEGE